MSCITNLFRHSLVKNVMYISNLHNRTLQRGNSIHNHSSNMRHSNFVSKLAWIAVPMQAWTLVILISLPFCSIQHNVIWQSGSPESKCCRMTREVMKQLRGQHSACHQIGSSSDLAWHHNLGRFDAGSKP